MRTPCYSVGCDPHVHQKNAYQSNQKRPYRALAISRLLQRDRAFYERCPDLLRALQRRISITKKLPYAFFRIRELFAPKNISAALLNPTNKNADDFLIGVIYQNLPASAPPQPLSAFCHSTVRLTKHIPSSL